ncbi:MAG: hypothetical protein ACUVRO_07000, partial [Armatimonadota bacterium]
MSLQDQAAGKQQEVLAAPSNTPYAELTSMVHTPMPHACFRVTRATALVLVVLVLLAASLPARPAAPSAPVVGILGAMPAELRAVEEQMA